MNPAKFIEKHIAAALVAEGFPPLVVEGGGKARTGTLPQNVSAEQEGWGIR